MKNIFICIATFLLLITCNKKDNHLSDVEFFIKNLKEDQTETIKIQDLEEGDISELLKYRNDKLILSNFPRNLLSSFYLDKVTLGMYVLWVVESIRIKSIDQDFIHFASLNPIIVRASTGELVDQEMILPIVAEAYYKWWNSNLSIAEKFKINPLEDLDLKWN